MIPPVGGQAPGGRRHPGGLRFRLQPQLPAAQIRDLAWLEFIAAGEGIIAYGPVGVGKSHLAAALGHEAQISGQQLLLCGVQWLVANHLSCLFDLDGLPHSGRPQDDLG